MSPLVALLVFGFMFVIALSLTIWAALTLGDARGPADQEDDAVSYVPLGTHRPVWRREEAERTPLSGLERRSQPSLERADGRRGSDKSATTTGLSRGLPTVSPQAAVPVVPVVDPPPEPRSEPSVQVTARSHKSNDDYRGARATVTQRPNNDDAFERFLENDRD